MKKVFEISDVKKDSNVFFLLEKKSDLKKLDFLELPAFLLENISEKIKKGKNTLCSYFIGEKNIENLYIYFYLDSEEDVNISLGKEVSKLPNHMVIVPNMAKNIVFLMNHMMLGRYKFEKYKSESQKDHYAFLLNKSEEDIFDERKDTIKNIIFARDLGSEPSNVLYPESFSKIVKDTKFKHTKVKILDYKDVKKEKMGLLEAVGKGSIHKPMCIILEKITDKKLPTIAIVGKGITFDTGGIQVKPGNVMYEMKGDMCGGASVLALAKELDKKDLNVNMVYVICLAENHISGESFKPSDIFTSYSGKTVDIIHTDAEGRLVLADGISYASKNYKPEKIISIATLTGACMVALGFRYAGIMGNDDAFINKFLKYSEKNFEKYNRLPFDKYFMEKTKSDIADFKNLTDGIYAGSSMAGAFLANFVLHDEAYTHIDIAGTALNSYEPYGYVNKGMTGFGVDSISEIIQNIK